MNWIGLLIFVVVIAAMILVRRLGQVSLPAAREHLRNGALLVDVRTQAEFAAGHLPKSINFPLNEIEAQLPRRVKDHNQALLLYCQSGMRSAIARRKLRAMGYTNVFQLGSYARAAHAAGNR